MPPYRGKPPARRWAGAAAAAAVMAQTQSLPTLTHPNPNSKTFRTNPQTNPMQKNCPASAGSSFVFSLRSANPQSHHTSAAQPVPKAQASPQRTESGMQPPSACTRQGGTAFARCWPDGQSPLAVAALMRASRGCRKKALCKKNHLRVQHTAYPLFVIG
jgi:hypothetical protein